jgi:hypothetical protein
MKLALAHSQIASLKAHKSSSSKCNCSSPVWTEVKAKSRCRTKSLPFIEDPKFTVRLSNKFEILAVSEPSKVIQDMNTEDPKSRLSNKKCKKVLLLGGSHGRGLREQLHSTLGDEYAVTTIFKPNAAIGNVAGDLKVLSKELPKEDHVIIVGGPGK